MMLGVFLPERIRLIKKWWKLFYDNIFSFEKAFGFEINSDLRLKEVIYFN